MFKTINWNTGSAATRFRHTRKKKKKNKAASLQAGGPALKESGLKLDRSNWGLPRIIK